MRVGRKIGIPHRFTLEAKVKRLETARCGAPLADVLQQVGVLFLEIAITKVNQQRRVRLAPGISRCARGCRLQTGNRRAQIVRIGEIHFADLARGAGAGRFGLLHESSIKLHATLAISRGHVCADPGDNRKIEIARERAFEDDAVGINQDHVRALPQKRNGSPLGDFNFDLVGKGAAYRGLLDPGNGLNLPPARIERNAQDAPIAVHSKDPADGGERYVSQLLSTVRGNLNLIGMDQGHFRRSQQKVADKISDTGGRETHSGPKCDARVRLPGFPAKLAPLDLERLLATKILRLLLSEDFLGENVRVYGS